MTRRFGYSWLVTAFLLTGLMAQSTETIMAAANEKVEQKDWKSAEKLFQKAVEVDPTNHLAYFNLGKVYYRMGYLDSALTNVDQALKMDLGSDEYRNEYNLLRDVSSMMRDAGRNMNTGAYDEAFQTYENASKKAPDFPEAYFSMGLAKFKMEDLDSAVSYFRKTLKVYPEHENAKSMIYNVVKKTFNEGNNAYRSRNYELAVQYYQHVLRLDSTFYLADYQLGVLQAKDHHYEEAIALYKKALQVKPDFYQGWYAIGLAQNKDGDSDEAIASYQKAIEINPGYTKAYVAIGAIYIDKKDFDNGKKTLEQAIQIDPNDESTLASLGAIYVEQEDFEGAVTYLESAVKNDKRHSDYKSWYHLAASYNKLGQCDKARDAARQCTQINRRFGGGWLELGISEYCNGKGSKTAALNDLETARGDHNWRRMAEYEIDKIKNPAKYEQ